MLQFFFIFNAVNSAAAEDIETAPFYFYLFLNFIYFIYLFFHLFFV
jgi:hypothetical protein